MSSRIAVVGGGIVGCAAALELARAGHAVTLYERGEIGRESSWAAGGVLTPIHIAEYPGPLAGLCVAAQQRYASFVASLEAPEVDFHTCGVMMLLLDDEDERDAAVLEGWRRSQGLPTHRLTSAEALREEPWVTPELRAALVLPEIMQVRNHRLTQAIARAARRAGAELRTNSPVRDPSVLEADRVVLAAGCWTGEVAPSIPVAPARGQMILLVAPPGAVRRIILWKDRYLIPRLDGRLLAGSTVEEAGFDKSVTDEGLSSIRASMRRMIPKTGELPTETTWAGLRPRLPDRLPVIDAVGKLIYVTGHFRNGILLGPITGVLVRELVEGRPPSVDLSPFRAARFHG